MIRHLAIAAIILLAATPALGQSAKERVGFIRLQDEIGASLEDGTGIRVGLVEAPTSAGAYLPNLASSQFAGKTITDASGTNTGTSSHANLVANNFFGNTVSMAGGITDITGYEANNWINSVLGFDVSTDAGQQRTVPQLQDFRVMNHSYISNGSSPAAATERNRRMDLLVNRDNVTMVVGANNGAASANPQLFSHSYNTITVGVTSGSHSHGLTTFNGAGRIKPEIVAPAGATSFATPLVSSAAAILRQQAATLPSGNASQNEVTKAALLAGATKSEFSTWSKTATRPLDSQFGAGELNIYNSYMIQAGGEFDGGTDAASTPSISASGWDYEASLGALESRFYNFDVTSDVDASIILTWNAEISDSGDGVLDYDTLTLANLDLQFYDSTGGFLGSLLQESISTVDNVEHIFLEDLGVGSYTIAVRNISGSTDYGLAWRFTAVPEPSSLVLLGGVLSTCLLRRRRGDYYFAA